MIKVKLNKRLSLVAEKVLSNSQVLDVGCDHAFLDIYLCQRDSSIRAVASDVHEGPIQIAKENIRKYGLEDIIETRIGSGIQTIDDGIDTVVISGMGGLNIVGILKYYPHLLKTVQRIIVSPNNYEIEVRKEISKLGFYLDDEDLIEERNHIYPVMVFVRGKRQYKKKEYVFSPILLNKKSSLYGKYLEYQRQSKEQILKVMPKQYVGKRLQLRRELKELNRVLVELKESEENNE